MAVALRMCSRIPGDTPAPAISTVSKQPTKVKLPLRALDREELLELQECAIRGGLSDRMKQRLKEEMREDGLVHSRILTADELRRELQIAANGLSAPYRGDGVDVLKHALDTRLENFTEDDYSQWVVVINSSGLGKTKTVLELGSSKNVFIFYCSLASQMASTMPCRTPYLADLLARSRTTWEMRLYYTSWLKVLLRYLQSGLGSLDSASSKWLKMQDLDNISPKGMLQREVYEEWLVMEQEFKSMLDKEEAEQEEQIQKMVIEAAESVLQLVGHKESGVKLLFAVDELLQSPPYLSMRRAAIRMGPCTLALAMGTMATVTDLAAYWKDDDSKRVYLDMKNLLKPIWHICTMDSQVHAHEVSLWKQDPAGWLVSMDRLSRCGRPLWYIRYSEKQNTEDLVDFALIKLLNIDGVSAKPGRVTMEQAIALLRFTVGLEVHPRATFAQQMVAKHMSTLMMISDEGRAIWTVAASEPILSEAACRWLREPAVLMDALLHLKDALHVQSVNAGDRGELVSSILLMLGLWQCQSKSTFFSPVAAIEFLRKTAGSDIKDEDVPFLKDRVVFFNRFVAIDHTPSQLELMEHFKKAEALCGTLGNLNHGADKWIPMWDGEAMEPEHFSAFMISDKNKTQAAANDHASLKLSAEYVGVQGIENLGYVTWLHDLRIEGSKFRTLVYNANGRVGFRLQGLRKSPVFQAGGARNYDIKIVELLEKLLEQDPYLGCDEEDKHFIRQCPPWMFRAFLPDHLEKALKQQEQSTCPKCKRFFKTPGGLKKHRCKAA